VSHDIKLRTAAAADYDRIIAVLDDWWGRPVRHSLPRVFLDHFYATSTVAESDGELAGFLIGFLSPSQPDAAYIHFVGVSPRLRGRRQAGGPRDHRPAERSVDRLPHRDGLQRLRSHPRLRRRILAEGRLRALPAVTVSRRVCCAKDLCRLEFCT
jgi:hypothetical protein